MAVDGTCYPLSTWGRRTSERDGGYWPTATATDAKSSRNATVKNRTVPGHSGVTLTDFVTLFPTPSASSYGTNKGGGAGRVGPARPGLETMARKNLWPTPVADDAVERAKGKWNSRGEPKLSAAVKFWPTPTARDWKSGAHGTQGNSRPLSEQVGGSLSPMWLEWLMGYAIGWTELEDWATAWFRPARAKPSND